MTRAGNVNVSWAVVLLMMLPSLLAAQSSQEKQSAADAIRNATRRQSKKQQYVLNYQIPKGAKIRWSVEHTASTRTKISSASNETSSRSNSVKVWEVKSVDSKGNMTFVHSIESVLMWQKNGDNDPIEFDSQNKSAKIPPEYESVPEKIGTPLATITINPQGQVLDRKSNLKNARFGAGDITVPFPSNPITIGHEWYVPSTLNATEKSGKRVHLKSRIHYTLSNVKGKLAFISFRTEVLSPIESEKVRSQIMQQMTEGYLVFDMNKGVPIRKEVEWDEKVHGYEGPDSFLGYNGTLSEKLLAAGETLQPIRPEAKVSKAKNASDSQKK